MPAQLLYVNDKNFSESAMPVIPPSRNARVNMSQKKFAPVHGSLCYYNLHCRYKGSGRKVLSSSESCGVLLYALIVG